MWTFLLVGSFAAVGAALAVGTSAALIRYFRTGTLPGHDEEVDLSNARIVGLSMRVIVGAAVAIYGIVSLRGSGLL